MKVMDAIELVRDLMEAKEPDTVLALWLSEHDGRVLREDFLRPGTIQYDPMLHAEAELIVEAPYDAMYLSWLRWKIHEIRGEYEDASNAAASWQEQHSTWIRNKMNTEGRDYAGRPMLWNWAECRQGSICEISIRCPQDFKAEYSYQILQGGKVQAQKTNIFARRATERDGLSLLLTSEDTAALEEGVAQVVLTGVHGQNRFEYEPGQLIVRKGVSIYAEADR